MRKVLVIRLSSLGDVVLTSPVFKVLRQAWPEAKITVLTKEMFADVLSENPDIDQVLLLRRGESIFSLVRRVRAEHFDVIIDLHANLRSRLVSFFSGAAQRARYHKAALARRMYVRWRRASPELQDHTLDRYFQALRNIGIATPALTHETGSHVQNILVIQTAFLGDAVLTLPFLNNLRTAYPSAAISVLCTPEIADVFERTPSVSKRVVFDKRGRDKSPAAIWRLAQRLREEKYDLAFLPHRSFKSALIAWLARIPRRVGFSTSQGRWLLTDVVPFRWGVHDADRNLALLKAVGVHAEAGVLSLHPEVQAQERVQERLRSTGISDRDAVLGIKALAGGRICGGRGPGDP
jgi:ADP-heptose:LPS heptosyltransferase